RSPTASTASSPTNSCGKISAIAASRAPACSRGNSRYGAYERSTTRSQVSTSNYQLWALNVESTPAPIVESRQLRLALVHDWLTGMRGGEKALEVLCERFPDAELFTLVHVRGSVSPAIERLRPHTSFVQHLPAVQRFYRNYLPLFPTAIEQFSFDRFDRVVSLSHCCPKSIGHPGGVPHLCYCLTPMRYAWDQFDAYFGPARLGATASALMRPVMARLARWDRDTAGRADRYVAISHYVAGRIRRYYNREATVVYPPVDTDFFRPGAPAEAGSPARSALIVSALVPYKRIEVAIDACPKAALP